MRNDHALAWWDANPKTPLAHKLMNGAETYRVRVGLAPTHVIVSPDEFAACVEAAPQGITVVPSSPQNGTVAKNNYWFKRIDGGV